MKTFGFYFSLFVRKYPCLQKLFQKIKIFEAKIWDLA